MIFLLANSAGINGVSFSPDGALLASCSGAMGTDNSVRLWDVASGTEVKKFEGHSRPVDTVCWSPDGSLLASSDRAGVIKTWTSDGEHVKDLQAHRWATFLELNHSDRCSRNGRSGEAPEDVGMRTIASSEACSEACSSQRVKP